jgi:hypothetical protein
MGVVEQVKKTESGTRSVDFGKEGGKIRVEVDAIDKWPDAYRDNDIEKEFFDKTIRQQLTRTRGMLQSATKDNISQTVEDAKNLFSDAKQRKVIDDDEFNELVKTIDNASSNLQEVLKSLRTWKLTKSEKKYLSSKEASLIAGVEPKEVSDDGYGTILVLQNPSPQKDNDVENIIVGRMIDGYLKKIVYRVARRFG